LVFRDERRRTTVTLRDHLRQTTYSTNLKQFKQRCVELAQDGHYALSDLKLFTNVLTEELFACLFASS
jgi:hypothetical protein